MSIGADIVAALPELFLAGTAIILLMLGVFMRDISTRSIGLLAVAALAFAGALIYLGDGRGTVAFNGLFLNDGFGDFMKVLVLIGAALTIVMALRGLEQEQMNQFEFPVLLVLATVGMLMMISANDLISLYMGLELQSLALYVVAAFRRDSLRSSEAGLKYFVLGSLASGMLLYGMSMVYGFTGSTSFDVLAQVFASQEDAPSIGLIVGIVFIAAGLAFKISAVPFHMWTPDVYEGAPTPVTAFLAAAPKVAAMALLVRVLMGPFGDLVAQWQQIVVFIALASMLLGSFAAIVQSNIKRLMAYSSIGHVGFALVGLAAGSEAGVRGVAVYMAIYLFMTVGVFAVILAMRVNGRAVEAMDDLKGLSKTNPLMALAMAALMFSMAGIPPLAGFFGKFYVFMAAVEAGLFELAVIGVLASVVAAYYYLRIVKVMYFDEPVEAFDKPVGSELASVLAISTLVIVLFVLIPGPIVDGAATAAEALTSAGR
ncbi:NADH-quinone oxidoreductase subunit NuoN [Aquibaculum arenosum]|uniref:NADH-quinone oxidoreductase subunit NuoN n=1 Tax=Aquibaculum arenosum TaxID=3032591 RepID=UPI002AC3261F|nr:NADH-quinone oxidoreductase subunit NuoN [Fodinicurvata sp. CAU 1616]